MAKGYLSNRQKNLRIGISSYTENKTVLEITGKVGVGTFDARSSLDVVADVNNSNWFVTYGSVGINTFKQAFSAVAFDSQGKIYSSGADYDNGVPFLTKFDTNGSILWEKFFEHPDSNKLYKTCETVTVDKTTDNVYVTINPEDVSKSSILVKLNSSGDILWQKEIDDIGYESASSIGIGTTGSVYVVGETNSQGQGNTDILVVKFDSSGTDVWQKTVGIASTDSGNGIAIDYNDNLYIVGGNNDAYIIKLNSSGEEVWQKSIGDVNSEKGYGVAIDSNNNIYVVGETSFLNAPNSNVFLIKFNSSGIEQWQKTINGDGRDSGFGIAIDNNKIYITGQQKSNQIIVASFNDSGDVLWKKEVKDRINGGLYQGKSYGHKLIDLINDNIIIGGYISNIQNNFKNDGVNLLKKRLIMNQIDYNDLIKDKVCVDAGCGSGRYSYALIKLGAKKVLAFDKNPDNIKLAKSRFKIGRAHV